MESEDQLKAQIMEARIVKGIGEESRESPVWLTDLPAAQVGGFFLLKLVKELTQVIFIITKYIKIIDTKIIDVDKNCWYYLSRWEAVSDKHQISSRDL